MPTFSRLTGAVLLAALAFVSASMARAYLPEAEPGEMLAPFSALIGAVVGWTFTGRHLDRGNGSPWAIGFGSVVLLVFWIGLIFGTREMVDRSMRGSYGGSPTDAVQDVFNIVIDYGRDLLQMEVVLTLVGGGLVIGLVTGFVGKHFR